MLSYTMSVQSAKSRLANSTSQAAWVHQQIKCKEREKGMEDLKDLSNFKKITIKLEELVPGMYTWVPIYREM